MKVFFLSASLVIAIAGCNESNNSSDNTSAADTSNHGTHNNGNTSAASTDTSSLAGKDMMSLMNSMMDNMKGMQSTGNPDNDFAALMKAHHLGAIEMAQMEVSRGTDPEVKEMAKKMIDDQQREVSEFNTFLSGHTPHGGGDAFFKEAMQSMDKMKMDMDHSGTVDKQFVQMMIPHHQSAIDMARAYIKAGAHEEKLKAMANNIISSQQKEINELQAWLARNK